MKKKKIAFVMGSMVMGGAEKALINLLSFFDYSDYECTVFFEAGGGVLQDQINSNVTVKYWKHQEKYIYKDYILSNLKQLHFYTFIKSLLFYCVSRFKKANWFLNFKYALLAMPISEERYDIIISYKALDICQAMISRYGLKSKRTYAWIHGEVYFDTTQNPFLFAPTLYDKMDGIICVSESIKENFLSFFPKLKDKTRVVYNIHNNSEIQSKSLLQVDVTFIGSTLMTVGRLSKEKGQDMIPTVARLLANSGYSFTWYIVGDGPLRQKIEENIRKTKTGEYVKLLGVKENPYPYILNCTVYVQTSHTEGFCLVTNEAKILKKPVVTTNVPGMHEQFDDESAVFCDDTPESIYNGIKKIIDNLEYYKKQTNSYKLIDNQKELRKLYDLIEER